MIVPAKEWEVQDMARDAGCRVAVFATDDDVTARDRKVARAAAWVSDGRIVLEHHDGRTSDGGALHDDAALAPQVAAALALFTMDETGIRPAATASSPPLSDAAAAAAPAAPLGVAGG